MYTARGDFATPPPGGPRGERWCAAARERGAGGAKTATRLVLPRGVVKWNWSAGASPISWTQMATPGDNRISTMAHAGGCPKCYSSFHPLGRLLRHISDKAISSAVNVRHEPTCGKACLPEPSRSRRYQVSLWSKLGLRAQFHAHESSARVARSRRRARTFALVTSAHSNASPACAPFDVVTAVFPAPVMRSAVRALPLILACRPGLLGFLPGSASCFAARPLRLKRKHKCHVLSAAQCLQRRVDEVIGPVCPAHAEFLRPALNRFLNAPARLLELRL